MCASLANSASRRVINVSVIRPAPVCRSCEARRTGTGVAPLATGLLLAAPSAPAQCLAGEPDEVARVQDRGGAR